ncbi:hypothetical protein DPEC_G00150470 [Dallia pectoralis]|uniref:Uncharacterized protein n=1 Tax=Dallia pectoralis TaxID=75939 RepID=A0ACC2GIS3_DALPE|nr:hypothetical protein DPEC_G00150470 [Dallia pectoralis]
MSACLNSHLPCRSYESAANSSSTRSVQLLLRCREIHCYESFCGNLSITNSWMPLLVSRSMIPHSVLHHCIPSQSSISPFTLSTARLHISWEQFEATSVTLPCVNAVAPSAPGSTCLVMATRGPERIRHSRNGMLTCQGGRRELSYSAGRLHPRSPDHTAAAGPRCYFHSAFMK